MHNRLFLTFLIWSLSLARSIPADLPGFDFTKPGSLSGWQAQHDLEPLKSTADGLLLRIRGSDPYLSGPAMDFPEGAAVWIHLRLKSDAGGGGEIFYFKQSPDPAKSVSFSCPEGEWIDLQIPLPALGPGWHIRLDPPGDHGECRVASIFFSERKNLNPPAWPRPTLYQPARGAISMESGSLRILHHPTTFHEFVVQVDGTNMAQGCSTFQIGYLQNGQPRWFNPAQSTSKEISVERKSRALIARFRFDDPEGVTWNLEERFGMARAPGTIDWAVRVTVDRPRDIIHLPLFVLLPGLGTFGEHKGQGLFSGLEYLDDEPSSSEADVEGAAARRSVPRNNKITIPLMAIQAMDRYVGLIWKPRRDVSALFDSPDRTFHSGAHVMGLHWPGSDGVNREEGSLTPYQPARLEAHRPLELSGEIVGGHGKSVVAAVQHYVRIRSLPPPPKFSMDVSSYFEFASAGWVHSGIGTNGLYHHALWPGFGPGPAADAASELEYLALHLPKRDVPRLLEAASNAWSRVGADLNANQVGHIRLPVPELIHGKNDASIESMRRRGFSLLGAFQPDGTVRYHAPPRGPDFGRTHSQSHANGLTAASLMSLLECAAWTGDPRLLSESRTLLEKISQYDNGVPRGAQTWEIPLHTPDILASAYLVRCYVAGFELFHDRNFLDRAIYWAWTGVPFIYLEPPTQKPVGLYGTIAVLGATHWKAPVWMGQPVQWCGLVYADALYRLNRYDASGPWKVLADGITISAQQQSWPSSDARRQGLLPDSFILDRQFREGPAINPGTLFPNALHRYGLTPLYDFATVGDLAIHVPGKIDFLRSENGVTRLKIRGWPAGTYRILVARLGQRKEFALDGQKMELDSPARFFEVTGEPVMEVGKE